MAVQYNKLWKLLVDRKMSKADLRKLAEIAPNTMTKLRRDEMVALPILDRQKEHPQQQFTGNQPVCGKHCKRREAR